MGHYRMQDDPPRGRSRPRGARDAYYDGFDNDSDNGPGSGMGMGHGPRFRSAGSKSVPQSPTRPVPLSDPFPPQGGRRRVPRPVRKPATPSSSPPPRRRARPRTVDPRRSPSPDKSRRPLRRQLSDEYDRNQDRGRYSRAGNDARPPRPRGDTTGVFSRGRRGVGSSSPSPVRDSWRQKQQGYPEREAGGPQRRRYQPNPWQEGNEEIERRDIRRGDADERRERRGDDRRGDDRRGTWAHDRRGDRDRPRASARDRDRDEDPRTRRTRSEEPSRRARHRGASPPRRSPQPEATASRPKKAKAAKIPALDIPWQALAMTAVQAGATAAYKARRDPGPWMGPKGTKVATAALGAAIADGFSGGKVRRKK